jgi:DPCD protein family
VAVADEGRQLVLRTSNRKFYRKWSVAGMARLGLKLDDTAVSHR